jgi:uncharacterized protein (TIGR02099 family)
MGLVAVTLIAAATLVGAASMMFPWLLSHPEKVQQFLSEQLKRPVQFGRLSGQWHAQGPIFSLDDLRIGGERGAPSLKVAHAELAFDFYAFLHEGRSWYELKIVEPLIDLQRDADGHWQVRQWSGGSHFDLTALRSLGAIGLRGARINLADPAGGRLLKLVDVELRVAEGAGGREVFARARTDTGTVPVQLACALDTAFASGRCYLRGRGLRAEEWLSTWPVHGVAAVQGGLDVDAWIDLVDFQPRRARLEVAADQVGWRGLRSVELGNGQTIEPRHSPDRMVMAMEWRRQDDGWRLSMIEGESLDAAGGAPRSNLAITRRVGAEGQGETLVEVQSLRLERVLPWLALSDALPPAFAGMLYESAPNGTLSDLVWHRFDGGGSSISGRFDGVGLQATRRVPRVHDLAGVLRGDASATMIELDAVSTDFSYPGVFRRPLPVQLSPMLIALVRQPQGLRVDVERLQVRGEGYALRGQVAFEFTEGGGKPFMDGVIEVLPGSVPAAKAVWPINVMPATTVQWLDSALETGSIDRGLAVIRGDLDDWPFDGHTGRFDSMADISDARVRFRHDWPPALLHSARAHFVNNGMLIDIASAEVLGSVVSPGQARIDDLKHPLLFIDAASDTDGQRLLDLIRASPLQRKFGAQLLGVAIDGAAAVDLRLVLPLVKDGGPAQVDGRVALSEANLRDMKWNLRFDKASGNVRFSESGFSADALNVRVQDHMAELNIAVGAFVGDEAHQLEASLRGDLPVAAVVGSFGAMTEHLERFPGSAQFDLALLVGRPDAQGVSEKRLSLRSDLRGIAIDLPAPLRKDAGTAMPLEFDMTLPAAGSRMRMQLGQLARFNGVAAGTGQPFAGHLALGGGLADALPEAGMRISGEAPAIDLSGWAGMDVDRGGAPMPLSVDVRAEEVDVLGRAFTDTHVEVERAGNSARVVLSGEGIDGSFEMASANSDVVGITARFKTLHWPDAGPSGQSKPLDPARVPPLHIWVGDLRLGQAGFGEARIETRPSETGMRIEEINTRSPTLTMRASGSWALTPAGERSALDITFSAEDIGKMLRGLGYGSVIEGGQTVARLDGSWSGSPAQFGLHRVRGTLEGEVGEGRILDVEPGAGRLFGLVSFTSIPRRLTLDFSDFFKSGMAFDSIRGSFVLDEGDAVTDDLRVKAPSAEIRIKGRAGLVARDYDQEMILIPGVRSVLPLVGAAAAGPIGAVVGVVAQDVLRKPLDGIVTARYRVSGSWDKPDIVLIAKEKRVPEAATSR